MSLNQRELVLCPESGYRAHTIVVVDKTDTFSPSQRSYLGRIIRTVGEEMRQFDKLSIYVLDHKNFSAPIPAFDLCNPGDGSAANTLYQNPRKIRAKFEATFGEPLDRAINALATTQTSPRSPIMEMIQEVALRDDFKPRQAPQRLILFSDMLQHMPGDYSQFRDPISFDWFAARTYAREVATSLGGADVEIVYLLNPEYEALQTRRHILFWEQYFKWINGNLVEVRPIR
ncbi:hypothetical protein KAJ83_12935 [Marivibrio halodurans]|uniref:Uncharacterized protein n=1 Tax=Marivibrio halodurans TaxID=2039722 RepID=A0A8J7S9H8_9PROT|nr:hypothetical protein [Marivibrio halodurans]MBP5857917.1 hypothetical protein [Marivibrio halodurans]